MKTPIIVFFLLAVKLPYIFSALIDIHPFSGPDAVSANLDVNLISERGFGNPLNMYSWSMESFKDKVYVGTLNVRAPIIGLRMFSFGSALMRFFTSGAEIYRGTKNEVDGSWSWEQVVSKGLTRKTNYGVRKMIAVGDYLYGVTGNHNNGLEVWRTFDGENWEVVNTSGFGTRSNKSARGLASFKGYLYVGVENRIKGAEIWRREIDENGDFVGDDNEHDWELVVDRGLEDNRKNIWVADMTVHDTGTDDYLYAGTFNTDGSQLWRSSDGVSWSNIYRDGNGIVGDSGAFKLISHDKLLYVGTANVPEGASLLVSADEEAIDFVPLFTKGMYGTKSYTYLWYIASYGGRLYTSYLNLAEEANFAVFSSDTPDDNESYVAETENGFDIADDTKGIRSMVVYNNTLIMGTASVKLGTLVFEAIQR